MQIFFNVVSKITENIENYVQKDFMKFMVGFTSITSLAVFSVGNGIKFALE